MFDSKIYDTIAKPTWCPGCGNNGIWVAIKNALSALNLPPEKVLIVGGIGCSGKIPHWINAYGFHGVHGRTLPVAQGAKLANHELTVIAMGGDGDGYSIGLSHFIHAMRRNLDITYIVHNNQIYGLTQGQASPTSDHETITKTSPHGIIEEPINPLALAIASGASFVGRGFSGDVKHLQQLFAQAIRHKGFAFVDVLQPCVTFNKLNTFSWFYDRIYKLEKYDTSDKIKAFKKSLEWGRKIPIGLFYKIEKPSFEEYLPQIKKRSLVKQKLDKIDMNAYMDEFV